MTCPPLYDIFPQPEKSGRVVGIFEVKSIEIRGHPTSVSIEQLERSKYLRVGAATGNCIVTRMNLRTL